MMHDDAQRRQEFRVESLHEPVSHYTDAVRWGDLLFMSGVAPLDKDLRLVSEDVVEQARKVFLNMKEVLDAAGATFADVLKVTVFLTDGFAALIDVIQRHTPLGGTGQLRLDRARQVIGEDFR